MPIEINGEVKQPWLNDKSKSVNYATFQAYNPNPTKILINGEKVAKPKSALIIPDTFTRVNENGSVEEVRYYKSKNARMVNKQQVVEYNTADDMIMMGGVKTINGTIEPDLLWFYRNSPDCQNGTFSKTEAGLESQNIGKVPLFFEHKPAETAKEKMEKAAVLEKCRALILREDTRMSNAQAKVMHKALMLGDTDNKWANDSDIVWSELNDFAENNPALFLSKFTDTDTDVVAMVKDAEDKGVIEFKSRKWHYKNTIEETDVTLICSVNDKETRYKDLVRFLVSLDSLAGQKDSHYSRIETNLKKHEVAKAETERRNAVAA